jgi:hypothetical protein
MKLLWAGTGSLVGLVLLATVRRRGVREGVVVGEGADWPRRLGWSYGAITLGHVVLAVGEIDEATFEHELVHVRQWERWGALLFVAYPLASLAAVLTGGHHYADNVFERRAREQLEGTGRAGRKRP